MVKYDILDIYRRLKTRTIKLDAQNSAFVEYKKWRTFAFLEIRIEKNYGSYIAALRIFLSQNVCVLNNTKMGSNFNASACSLHSDPWCGIAEGNLDHCMHRLKKINRSHLSEISTG